MRFQIDVFIDIDYTRFVYNTLTVYILDELIE